MNIINSYIMVAILLAPMVGVAVSFVRQHRSDTSESRMKRMMVCCGIDEVAAKYADHLLKLDMSAIRHRCRHCPDTSRCDQWLDGEAVAGNDFCPNRQQFKAAAGRRIRVAR